MYVVPSRPDIRVWPAARNFGGQLLPQSPKGKGKNPRQYRVMRTSRRGFRKDRSIAAAKNAVVVGDYAISQNGQRRQNAGQQPESGRGVGQEGTKAAWWRPEAIVSRAAVGTPSRRRASEYRCRTINRKPDRLPWRRGSAVP